MLQPKRIKHRKVQKGRIRGIAQRGHQITYGTYGLKALEPHWLTARQIEAARRTITRAMKRAGILFCRIFPDKPRTKKPAEVRMGSGKGSLDHFVATVKPGTILYELEGVPYQLAKQAFYLASKKLPIKTLFIMREDYIPE